MFDRVISASWLYAKLTVACIQLQTYCTDMSVIIKCNKQAYKHVLDFKILKILTSAYYIKFFKYFTFVATSCNLLTLFYNFEMLGFAAWGSKENIKLTEILILLTFYNNKVK